MARPVDWAPLAESDPAPGDTDAIRTQVTTLTRVADSILDQVAALRRVTSAGQDGELRGQFAATIGSKAGELADHLGKAEGRYRTASSELKQWLAELEQAQQDTLTQLGQAKTAAQTIDALEPPQSPGVGPFDANAPLLPPPGSKPAPLSPQQRQNLSDAHATLDAARRDVARIQADLDARAAAHERNIKAASQHDGLKDSRWDRLKTSLHGTFGRIISDVCNGLGWIATGLAIAALFFPGVDLLVIGAFAATLLAAGGHSLLASAGAGSWFDVGADAVGLLSFGAGAAIGKGLDASVSGLKSTLEGGASIRAGAKAFDIAKQSEGVTALEALMSDDGVGLAEKAFNLTKLNESFRAANAAKVTAESLTGTLAKFTHDFSHAGFIRPGLEVALEGSHKAAAIRAWLRNVTEIAGDDPAVASGVAKVTGQLNKAQGLYGFASVVDLGDKTLGSVLPYFDVKKYYSFTRSPFTFATGSSW